MAKAFELRDFAYAHRGLWSEAGPVENSMEAFHAAAAAGLGMEFDVRPSSDDVPMVFHDRDLSRLTQRTDPVNSLPASVLGTIALKDGDMIPTLADLLAIWPHDLPLLCEIKIDPGPRPERFIDNVCAQLRRYAGCAAAMSFDMGTVALLPRDMMRGQLLTPIESGGAVEFAAQLENAERLNCNYLACHTSDAAQTDLQAWREDKPLICWTVRSEPACAELRHLTDAQIFEGFAPERAQELSGALSPQ